VAIDQTLFEESRCVAERPSIHLLTFESREERDRLRGHRNQRHSIWVHVTFCGMSGVGFRVTCIAATGTDFFLAFAAALASVRGGGAAAFLLLEADCRP
jgi:membrane-bound metal-dependent hydrolase YbcI (DUF457 family)